MNDRTPAKADEPRNPSSSEAPAAAEAGRQAPPQTTPQPPGGYAGPLRRERGSGLVDPTEAATDDGGTDDAADGEHLETTLGDHGGTG